MSRANLRFAFCKNIPILARKRNKMLPDDNVSAVGRKEKCGNKVEKSGYIGYKANKGAVAK